MPTITQQSRCEPPRGHRGAGKDHIIRNKVGKYFTATWSGSEWMFKTDYREIGNYGRFDVDMAAKMGYTYVSLK